MPLCNINRGDIMLTDYIEAVMSKARYEIIEDEEPYYGEVPELEGVWASGKTLEECRKNLAGVIDGWIIVKLRKGLPLPPIGAYKIEELSKVEVSV